MEDIFGLLAPGTVLGIVVLIGWLRFKGDKVVITKALKKHNYQIISIKRNLDTILFDRYNRSYTVKYIDSNGIKKQNRCRLNDFSDVYWRDLEP